MKQACFSVHPAVNFLVEDIETLIFVVACNLSTYCKAIASKGGQLLEESHVLVRTTSGFLLPFQRGTWPGTNFSGGMEAF